MPSDIAFASASGTWSAPPAQVRAAITEPVYAVLDELGVIAASGADAAAFLHAQLTNDVLHLDATAVQLNGYCTPKGRLLAVFDNWRDATSIYLQLPRELLAPTVKRLSMFVLRQKVKLEDASQRWCCIGLVGPGAATLVAGVPADRGVRVARLRPAARVAERYLILAPREGASEWLSKLAPARRVDSAAWWWTQIDAGIPNVFAATVEKFVPQMINLEVLGGVNFKKGCYPGQEVVARSQYLGKLRRRMSVAHVEGETHAGADVFAAGSEQPVGTVVMAATAPEGGMDLLFECPIDRLADALSVNGATGPKLTPRPLPYELIDPTA
jgi:folate-binding protein YgfZ